MEVTAAESLKSLGISGSETSIIQSTISPVTRADWKSQNKTVYESLGGESIKVEMAPPNLRSNSTFGAITTLGARERVLDGEGTRLLELGGVVLPSVLRYEYRWKREIKEYLATAN